MKKKNNNYKILFLFIGIIVFISALYFSLNGNANLSLTYLKDMLYKPFIDINNKNDIVGKNLNVELVEENDKLKELANISYTLSGFKNINATVIERNHSFWLESMTINKGKKDGIDIGMAVVVSEGLVGKIVNITNNTSLVKLITSEDNNNKISVKIKVGETYIYKVLEYENNDLVINGIEKDIELNAGASVITSGLSDIYPSGIIVGEILKIENDNYGISKRAYIKSKVSFDNLRFVSVLEREA